ncbi:MAG: tail fiber domain-containing protein [Arcticibacter sp.]
MKANSWFIMVFAIIGLSVSSTAQSIRQFNAQFTLSTIKSLGNSQYQITGTISDPSNTFYASQVLSGDQIIDKSGNAYKILAVTSISGSVITADAQDLNGAFPTGGLGIIFRPSANGYPMIAFNTPASVLNTAINTSTISINSDLPKFSSGVVLPTVTYHNGQIVRYSITSKFYKLENSEWTQLAVTPTTKLGSNISSIPVASAGSVIFLSGSKVYYISDGTIWVVVPSVTSLPSMPKFGDVYYQTGEKKLYMMAEGGGSTGGAEWLPISSSSIPGGGSADLPASPNPGDLFFNTDENKLFVFDVNNEWIEVSINGSTPGGVLNPDPAGTQIVEGRLFYNTTEKQLYVFNGSTWMPLGNALASGQIYVGNPSNVAAAVSMSGDATITNSGKLTVKPRAISDEKLDKSNIPLSGFATPTDHVSLGDGITNYKIVNLANPSAAQDAVTKSYVDVLFMNPTSLLTLPSGNFFVGNSSNKAVATLKSAIPLSGFGLPTSNIAMNNKLITGLASPSNDGDAANKLYVDTRPVYPINISLYRNMLLMGNDQGQAGMVEKKDIAISELGAAKADLSMDGFKISNLGDPLSPQDAATKYYVDNKVLPPSNLSLPSGTLLVGNTAGKAVSTAKVDISLSGFGAAAADVLLGNHRILNLAAPLNDSDASTKKYVDDLLLNPSNTLALPSGNFFVGNANGKATATLKSAIPVSGFGKATETLFMGDGSNQFNISNLAEPLQQKDAATKFYVDQKVSNPSSMTLPADHLLLGSTANVAEPVSIENISLSRFGGFSENVSLSNYKLTNLADPVLDQDAVNKKFLAAQLSGITSQLSLAAGQLFLGNASGKATGVPKSSIALSGFGVPEADIALGNHKLTGLLNPTDDQDAATKNYVDSQVGGSVISKVNGSSLLGNNSSSEAPAQALSTEQVKTMLALNKVDNTADASKVVASATKLTTAVSINGVPFDGSSNITVPGDNLGDHTATQNIKTLSYSISSDGSSGRGLSFESTGSAVLAQDLTVKGNLYTPSDRELKTRIETLCNALQSIDQMRGVRFEYKDQKRFASGPKIGVIAQELQPLFPEMVLRDSAGFLKVDYTQLSGLLIQAVKEQYKIVKQQQLEIDALKVKMNDQQQQIDLILQKLK